MQPALNQPSASSGLSTLMLNPLIGKLNTIDETDQDSVTYVGIARKCLGFLAAIFVGVFAAMLLQTLDPIVLDANADVVYMPTATIVLCVLSLIGWIVTPLLAFLLRSTIPVTGTIFCASVGYVFTFLSALIPEYRGAVLLALLLTVAIVAVMALVYAKGWIKVTQKFRSVLSVLFWTTVAASLLVGVCTFIPAMKCVPELLQANPAASIVGSLLYVVIAALFLLVDFDTIQRAVERKLPRKYEWYAAFGLAFSVIWLYMKLFSLIAKAKNGSKQ